MAQGNGDQGKPIYAAIDIGSNNVRMNLYAIGDDGQTHKVEIGPKTTFHCRLGQDLFPKAPVIKTANLDLAVEAVATFNLILDAYGIERSNTCVVMTEAVRAVQHTRQGKADIARLSRALCDRPFTVLTEREEALLDGEAVKLACPEKTKSHRGTKTSVAFAAIGGASVQFGVINVSGDIVEPVSLPYGIYPLLRRSHGQIPDAGKIFELALRAHYPRHKHRTLIVLGRFWRALGETVCKAENPRTLNGKRIREQLIAATHRKKKYYENYRGRVRDCAEHLPLAAAMLRRTAHHFRTKKIVFVETSIRDSMADQMHKLRTGQIREPSRGLERLFSP